MIGTEHNESRGRSPASLPIGRLRPPGLVLNTLRRFEVRTIGDLLTLDLLRVRREP